MEPDEYECERCHGVFKKRWSDEAAASEADVNFGDIDDPATICDPCFREFKAWYKDKFGIDLLDIGDVR